jgi:hypothetical protein
MMASVKPHRVISANQAPQAYATLTSLLPLCLENRANFEIYGKNAEDCLEQDIASTGYQPGIFGGQDDNITVTSDNKGHIPFQRVTETPFQSP